MTFNVCLLKLLWLTIILKQGHLTNNTYNMNIKIEKSPNNIVTHVVTVLESQLRFYNVTKEDVEATVFKADKNGKVYGAYINNVYIPVEMKLGSEESHSLFFTKDKEIWFATRANYTNCTTADFEDDETLVPINVSVMWNNVQRVAGSSITVSLHAVDDFASVEIDGKVVFSRGNPSTSSDSDSPKSCEVLLYVFNPYTKLVTVNASFQPQLPSGDEELIELVKSIQSERIAILTTLTEDFNATKDEIHGGSSSTFALKFKSLLASSGSIMSASLAYKDNWLWIWLTSGRTATEAVTTSFSNKKFLPSSPVFLEALIQTDSKNHNSSCFDVLPQTVRNKVEVFCDLYDGYGFCRCDRLDELKLFFIKNKSLQAYDTPTVIIAANRPRYLYRLLKQIFEQPGVNTQLLLVSVDGVLEEPVKLLDLLGILRVVYKSEGVRHYRVSRHLRFALFSALRTFPNAETFIILEEDLILGPDFYSFMNQTKIVIKKDSTVYSVSAYSHMAFMHTASNTSTLYRAHSLPSPGWMTTRLFLEEVLPMWPPVYLDIPWDYWIETEYVRNGRETVFPEVPRIKHGGLRGLNSDEFLDFKFYFGKPLSNDALLEVDISSIFVDSYENLTHCLLGKAILLNVSNPYEFDFPVEGIDEVYLAFFSMEHSADGESYKILADAINVWKRDVRDHHFGLWKIPYFNTTLLLMGVPFSKYTKDFYSSRYSLVKTSPFLKDEYQRRLFAFTIHADRHTPHDFYRLLGIF